MPRDAQAAAPKVPPNTACRWREECDPLATAVVTGPIRHGQCPKEAALISISRCLQGMCAYALPTDSEKLAVAGTPKRSQTHVRAFADARAPDCACARPQLANAELAQMLGRLGMHERGLWKAKQI